MDIVVLAPPALAGVVRAAPRANHLDAPAAVHVDVVDEDRRGKGRAAERLVGLINILGSVLAAHGENRSTCPCLRPLYREPDK